jgi:hypothetical protein
MHRDQRMSKFIKFTSVLLFLFWPMAVSAADLLMSVTVTLPEDREWVELTNQSDGDQYLREWIPSTETIESTTWLIVEQKFLLKKKISAKKYIQIMFDLARDACTDVLYNGPDKIKSGKLTTYVGRIMCAQQKGKPYGTFTDQRVISDGFSMFVVTSELRLPSSEVAGTLASKEVSELQAFMNLQGISAGFVRKSVNLCPEGSSEC